MQKVVAPCSAIALMTQAASTSEGSVNFYQATRGYNPEGSHLHYPTPYSRDLGEKLTEAQRVKFPTFHRTRRFVATIT
jgi:hypothetical protein